MNAPQASPVTAATIPITIPTIPPVEMLDAPDPDPDPDPAEVASIVAGAAEPAITDA